MDHKIKQLVIESINESREDVINHFRTTLLHYPYHPKTKFVILEIRGYGGDYGVEVSAMADWDEQLMENAHGEPAELEGFQLDVYYRMGRNELDQDSDLLDEIDVFVLDYLVTFFQECFNEAGGKISKIPYYLFYPNSGEIYDLVKEKWTDQDDEED